MSTLKVGTINTPNGSGNITFSRPTVLQAGDIVEADIADNAVTLAKMAGGVDGNIISYDASGDPVAVVTGSSGQVLTSAGAGAPPTFAAAAAGGKILQVVNTQTGALATGTTIHPEDDTIPQNTEGNEFMTLAITPANSSNKLIIEIYAVVAHSSTTQRIAMSLFQDSTANALATIKCVSVSAGHPYPISNLYYMTAGTTSATTFKVRIGADGAGTLSLNGEGGARKDGGVRISSITIWEIAV